MVQLVEPRAAEGEEEGSEARGDGPDREASTQKKVDRREIQQQAGQDPALKGGIRRKSDRPPGGVQRQQSQGELGVRRGVGLRVKDRRAPQVAMEWRANEPEIVVLEHVVDESGVLRIVLHSRKTGKQNRVAGHDRARGGEERWNCPSRQRARQRGQASPPRRRLISQMPPDVHLPAREQTAGLERKAADGSPPDEATCATGQFGYGSRARKCVLGAVMLKPSNDYRSLFRDFAWEIPPRFNIGRAVTQRAAADALALIEISAGGKRRDWRFAEIAAAANPLANGLIALGAQRGDRVGILLGQSAGCAISHVAIYRAGLLAVPLFGLFGPEALEYRLFDCGALRDRRRGWIDEAARDSPATARAEEDRRHQRRRAQRDGRLRAPACRWIRSLRGGRYCRGRASAHHLHLGNDRAAQGGASTASNAPWTPAWSRAAPRLLSAARRLFLDTGRLGVDRGPARCFAALLVSRRAGGGMPDGEIRSRASLRPDVAPGRAKRLSASDCRQADAPGARSQDPTAAAQRGERRRNAGRRAARLGPRHVQSDDQRILRTNRVQPGRRQ